MKTKSFMFMAVAVVATLPFVLPSSPGTTPEDPAYTVSIAPHTPVQLTPRVRVSNDLLIPVDISVSDIASRDISYLGSVERFSTKTFELVGWDDPIQLVAESRAPDSQFITGHILPRPMLDVSLHLATLLDQSFIVVNELETPSARLRNRH